MNSTLQKINIINDKLLTIGLLPASYLVSMTYEEQLLWLCNYIENTLIPKMNELIETFNSDTSTIEETINSLIDLAADLRQEMEDLDVQINDEVDAKLQAFMTELEENIRTITNEKLLELIRNGELIVSLGIDYDDATEELTFSIDSEIPSELIGELETLTTPTEGGE